ncbi:MAG: helix-turn-helix transcriptional regulator [Alistipes sp.]|nr:helix-turn-helix transcriptional regulator [Alistipes sp.]
MKITVEIISGKWKCCIINYLANGLKRLSELHRAFSDATPRVINLQLKELEFHGIIS